MAPKDSDTRKTGKTPGQPDPGGDTRSPAEAGKRKQTDPGKGKVEPESGTDSPRINPPPVAY